VIPPNVSQLLDEVLRQAQDLGFFGPGEIRRHRAHADAFVALVLERLDPDRVPRARFLDLGSGGGLPGLVFAAALPDCVGTLLDSQHRRTAFLEGAVAELGWSERITVVAARAEDAARDAQHRGAYDLVMARSFGPPAVAAECAVGFLSKGGRLFVSEPPGTTEDRWNANGLGMLGFAPPAPEIARGAGATVAALTLGSPTPDRYPRRPGIPAKRPLW
jgi:16S rRNA (guanine527-N7)-methyltransferase